MGGGSLVYANTLMTPPSHVFKGKYWPKGVDWKEDPLWGGAQAFISGIS